MCSMEPQDRDEELHSVSASVIAKTDQVRKTCELVHR